MLWWICDGCHNQVQSDPHSHSDWGGVIELQGPRCEECDRPMDLSPDQDEEEPERERE